MSIKCLLGFVIKDFKLLFSSRVSVFFVFFFPLIFMLFFGSIYDKNNFSAVVDLGVVNLDSGEHSTEFIRRLAQKAHINIAVRAKNENTVKAALKIKKISSYIVLNTDFSRQYETLDTTPNIVLVNDPSQSELVYLLKGALKEVAAQRFAEIMSFSQADFQPANIVEKKMITQEHLPEKGFILTLSQSAVWISFGLVTAFISFMGLEVKTGCLVRFFLSSIGRLNFLLYKGFSLFLAQLILIHLTFLGCWLFTPFAVNVLNLSLSVIVISLCFTATMLVASSLIDIASDSASSLVNAILLSLGMLSGAMVPLSFMPDWLLSISQLSPVYHVIFCLEGSTWRELALVDIFPSLLFLLTIALLCFTLSVKCFKLNQ